MLRAMSLVALGISVALLALLGWPAGAGFAGGVAIGAGMLWALVFCANKLVVAPGETHGPRWPYLLLHVGKFAGAVVLAWLLVVVLGASVAAFAAGYGMALAVTLMHLGAKGRVETREG